MNEVSFGFAYFHIIQRSMILIADSGSTKTNWVFLDSKGREVLSRKSVGLNPYFVTGTEIRSVVEEVSGHLSDSIEKVLFYGAGCGKQKKADVVQSAIHLALPNSQEIQVEGDILGAARSTLQHQEGISCIIGTGANSCVYDGRKVVDNVPSLGYLLADFGSGAVLGKDTIALLLQKKLPIEIQEDFYSTYQMDDREILDRLYNRPIVNSFLASFTPFLLKHSHVPELELLIEQNFKKFFEYFILSYKVDLTKSPITLVGSIAYHFRSFLYKEAENHGLQISTIVKNPLDGLVQFHTANKSKAFSI
ncbi:N-acetylglucosamine kinase [Belliella sp. R4-6]|uniref:N-acetylglucosamine kinase n=1 Tax=Belliella alkalica TaxID=1730871 RepID=A0ABS9V9I9_9BACT|nr:N-acetylglucosamine kinase [Belliella alkalica]